MSRITIGISEGVANKLVAKKREEYQALCLAQREYADKLVINQTSAEVMKAFEKFPEYINSQICFKADYPGFGHGSFNTTKNLPCRESSNYIDISEEEAKILLDMIDECKSVRKSIDELYLECKNTLLSLKTFKRVEEFFPEAAKFLPKNSASYLPAVNISKLQEKLKG